MIGFISLTSNGCEDDRVGRSSISLGDLMQFGVERGVDEDEDEDEDKSSSGEGTGDN